MKILILISLYVGSALAHDHPSVHGMLLLGHEKVYLSHLPMFHSPHDYQVILEVKLDRNSRRDGGLYTLVPEVFVLPEMLQHPRPFKAQIYKGHFERGGQLVQDVTVTITKIIFQKKFDPKAVRPVSPEFILFGSGAEQFLAHEIMLKPDYDQVQKVRSPFKPETSLQIKNLEGIEVEKEIYYEAGDLT